MDRRSFLAGAGAALATSQAGLGSTALAATLPAHATAKAAPTIGIQIGAISFQDEGTEKVLDILQEKGACNALFIACFTYGDGIAGRQLPGHPFPDHGVQKEDNFFGGFYTTPHPQYFRNTKMVPQRAPDAGGYDVLADVIPKAKKRGMKTYTWSEDVWNTKVPNFDLIAERDLYGRPAKTACFRNPDHHEFLMSTFQDWTHSYEIDGVMWGSERYGPFGNMVESVHQRNGNDPSRVTCFCQYCQKTAAERGINVSRAIEGYKTLEQWVRFCRGGGTPPDGHYVTFWRMLFQYPEILAWETMWNDGVHETYKSIHDTVKSVNPKMEVGWHVWHAHSFSPFFRAQTNLKKIAPYTDFAKMTVYDNLGGTRMETYITSASKTMYGDMPVEEALEFEYRIMGYRGRSYTELPYVGLDSTYVFHETKRSVEDVAGTNMQIWPGLDVDISNMNVEYSHTAPPGISACTRACFEAGGTGLVISRKYSEMKLANLAAVGDTLRQMKVV
ncbi:hypothetical protein [Terriglobus sp.]|uniref:hypothetical protein n=1 Tax=Terriglobus sp. TaxID=1889013 RepID=UPI003AFFD4D2